MRIIRVFPRRTSLTPSDELAFVGNPPLFLPDADEVHVSVAYTWDKPEAERLLAGWGSYYPAKIGGPAYSSPVDEFVPGRYLMPGVTFTSRGCNNSCSFCLVPEREGKLQTIADFSDGYIIQDNNLLQCSKFHIHRVFDMLKRQKKRAIFSGGLEARRVDDEIADGLRSLRIEQLFLAADTTASLVPLEKAIKKLAMPRDKVRVYVLIGREPIDEALERLVTVWKVGGLPFAQLFQPADKLIEYPREWKQLARTWSRPAATKAFMKEEEMAREVAV